MEANWRKNYLRYKSFFLDMLSQYRERSDWRAYLEILLSLSTISVFAIFALRPTVLTIAQLIKEIDEKETTLERMDGKIQNLSKAQILFDRERGNITLLEQISIPTSVKSDVFARQVEGLSSKYQTEVEFLNIGAGSIIGSSEPQTGNSANALEALPESASSSDFTFSVKAEVDQYIVLTQLLSDFENLRRPAKIDRIEFTTQENEDKVTNNILLLISGRLAYLP